VHSLDDRLLGVVIDGQSAQVEPGTVHASAGRLQCCVERCPVWMRERTGSVLPQIVGRLSGPACRIVRILRCCPGLL
jgi:hypothetical protein